MSEGECIGFPAVEKAEKLPYPFLEKLVVDHPELTHKTITKLPGWKSWLDSNIGNSQIAEAILNNIDYTSFEEIDRTVKSWGEDIVSQLTQNPQKNILILEGVGGSQTYFAHEVAKSIPEELLKRVKVTGYNEQMRNLRRGVTRDNFDLFANTDYYLFDDSANSGQQITGSVFPDFKYMTENLEKIAFDKKRIHDFVDLINGKKGEKPRFKIRTMRITHDGEKRLKEVWEKQRMQNDTAKMYPQLVELDLKSGGYLPTTEEVLVDMRSLWPKGERPAMLFRQNQVMGYPILGFFATKIQDNLPGVLIKNFWTPAELDPLFTRTDIKTPWKSKIAAT